MIEVTKINGSKVLINPDLMELVEETPDTVITFTTGRKIIVKESRQEVKNLVKLYRKDIFQISLLHSITLQPIYLCHYSLSSVF